MDEKQKASAHRRRTRAEIQQLVAEFMSSGIRRSEFCHSRGMSFGTLNHHLKKLRWKKPQPDEYPVWSYIMDVSDHRDRFIALRRTS